MSAPGVLSCMNDSYSQEGEDLVLRRLFSGRPEGFYVDVGAHHPFRFSNTYRLYSRGWRGINIDPNPVAMKAFVRHRRRDINLCFGIADKPGTLVYHSFNESALNTFDETIASERLRSPHYRKYAEESVAVERLSTTLERFLPAGTHIDFLNVDVEGLDLQVLRSNDWERFRPTYVLVEALRVTLDEVHQSPIYAYMSQAGYTLIAKTFNTFFFQDLGSRGHDSA